MASYQQLYDPNSYQVTGYQLPYESILSTLNKKTINFIDSAQRIKNQYDSVFGMDLTNEGNKEQLSILKDQADEKLKTIVKKDLSLGENSSQALSLFDPIVKNKNFLYDEAITNQVKSGISKAYSESKKSGSQYFNTESVKALNNTLSDLRTANVNDPGWQDNFLSDTYGTNYIPYDPKIDKDFETEKLNYAKTLREKRSQPIAAPDGSAYYLSETDASPISNLEMQQWIKENQPEQQRVNSYLRAKNNLHDSRDIALSSPQNYALVKSELNNIKESAMNSDLSIINTTINRENVNLSLIADHTSPLYTEKQQYIKGLTDLSVRTQQEYDKIDVEQFLKDKKYGDDRLGEIYMRMNVNSQVGVLGLDGVSQKLVQDASATSIAMNREDNINRLQVAALNASAKGKGKQSSTKDEQGNLLPNPNIQPSTILNPGDVNQTGEQTLQDIQSQHALKQLDITRDFTKGIGMVVNTPEGNVDVLTGMAREENQNLTFQQFLDKSNLSSANKEILIGLASNAYASNNTTANTKDWLMNVNIPTIMRRLTNAFRDEKNFTAAIQRSGVMKGSFVDSNGFTKSYLDELSDYGFQSQQAKIEKQNLDRRVSPVFRQAAKQAHLGPDSLTDEQLIGYTFKDYVDFNRKDLRGKGFTDTEINDFKSNPDKYSITDYNITGSTTMGAPVVYHPYKERSYGELANLTHKWKDYQDKLKQGLGSNQGAALLANTTNYSVVAKEGSDFDPNSQITSAALSNVLISAHNADSAGNQSNPDSFKAFDQARGTIVSSDVLEKVQPVDDGINPYVLISPSVDGAKKIVEALKAQGVDDASTLVEHMSQMKLYVGKDVLRKYFGFGEQSDSKRKFANGAVYSYSLPSGNKFTLRNVGVGTDLNIEPDGSFKYIRPKGDGSFEIQTLPANYASLQSIQIQDPQLVAQIKPENIGSNIYTFDNRASTLENILKSYHIDSTKFRFSDLPESTQKIIIDTFPNYNWK